MSAVTFQLIDAPEWRAAEIRLVAPRLPFVIGGLPAGYATSAPDPTQRARDKVAAFTDLIEPVFAEAADLLTIEGKSLRLDLDSDNEARFCRHWRETPTRLVLCVALRRSPTTDIEVFTGTCEGRIADRPAGERNRGWDRIFYPVGHHKTLAELSLLAAEFGHNQAYAALAAAVGYA